MDGLLPKILFTLAVSVYFYIAYHAVRETRDVYLATFALVGLLYPAGEVMQVWLFGPGWVRWYLSDLGWVSYIGMYVLVLTAFGSNPHLLKRRLYIWTTVGFSVAIGLEFLDGLPPLADPFAYTSDEMEGDWIDMYLFTFGYLASLFLIVRSRPIVYAT